MFPVGGDFIYLWLIYCLLNGANERSEAGVSTCPPAAVDGYHQDGGDAVWTEDHDMAEHSVQRDRERREDVYRTQRQVRDIATD